MRVANMINVVYRIQSELATRVYCTYSIELPKSYIETSYVADETEPARIKDMIFDGMWPLLSRHVPDSFHKLV